MKVTPKNESRPFANAVIFAYLVSSFALLSCTLCKQLYWLLGACLSVADDRSFWRIPSLVLRRRSAQLRNVRFFVVLIANLNAPWCDTDSGQAALPWSTATVR